MMKLNRICEISTLAILVLCLDSLDGFGFSDPFQSCEESMASIVCDEFLNPAASCADLMPKEEQNIFFECATECGVTESSEWSKMLNELCSISDTVKVSQDIISCWNDKMNATVDDMANDQVYPIEHFICKGDIYMKAVSKLSCVCQVQMGSVCGLPSFG